MARDTASRRPDPEFFTVNDVAERWQTSTKHVRRLIAKGALPIYRFGNALRVGAPDLYRYERAQRLG